MNSTRRHFLKIAGLSVLGVGARPVIDAMAGAEPAKVLPGPKALTAKRWAMVVDHKKCLQADPGCTVTVMQPASSPALRGPKATK